MTARLTGLLVWALVVASLVAITAGSNDVLLAWNKFSPVG